MLTMNPDTRTQFPSYEWPDGKRCAVIFSVDVDAESPYLWRNRMEPKNGVSEIEQRRYGPRQGMSRIMGLLEKHAIKGSFYVPGIVAQTYPDLLPRLLEQGHEVAYHGYLHERLDALAPETSEAFLSQTMEIFERQTGLRNLGYRSPSFEHTPQSLALLKRMGVSYDSTLMGFDHPYEIDGLTEIPTQWTLDDILYFAYTENRRDKLHPANPIAVLETWQEEFEGTREAGGLMIITVHDWVSGRPPRIRLLDRLLDHIRQHDDVWLATSAELARYHEGSVNKGRFSVTTEKGQFPTTV
ncbi:polysaccharide deacetylase family protein [Paracandidimonas soli]|uniref:Peptidoglycan/xylan/chitin deacetylase (PgdA/CDA1 family) n=1 Tax=Paracandidimonas soli TaxID=1917182 RepID=A0A4R3VGW9_9BURK|nr:polysaccharide deacetylase [Paracandidimonas soli]TCV03273.1 peptidoglycan/xylan/chitin deacetylase (PgdA/CDA1 family) [Paracandidimonas soli]